MRMWPFQRKITAVQKDQLEAIPTVSPSYQAQWKRQRRQIYEINIYQKGTIPEIFDLFISPRCHEWDIYDGKLKWTLYDLDQEEIGVIKSAGSCNDWGYYLVHRVEK